MSKMTPPKGNKARKSNDKQHATPNLDASDVSFDTPNIKSIDSNQTWKKCIEDMQLSFQSKLDALMLVIENKDKQITGLSQQVGKLSSEIEHLKEGYGFLSKETSEIKEKMVTETIQADKKIAFLESKAQDLEDRSRRCNLIFFGVPEVASTTFEDCDKTICNILKNHGILSNSDAH